MTDASREFAAGCLVVIRGCMFAGKTACLIERLEEARAAGLRVAAFKHQVDDRYDPADLVTHDRRRFAARAVGSLQEIERIAAHAEVVGIDEVHFFGKTLVPLAMRLVRAGRTVILSGIDHDAWGQAIPPLPELAAFADVDELRCAPCSVCGDNARYSQRVVPVPGEPSVGGGDPSTVGGKGGPTAAGEVNRILGDDGAPTATGDAGRRAADASVPTAGDDAGRMVGRDARQMVGGPAEYQPRCAAHFTPLPPPAPRY